MYQSTVGAEATYTLTIKMNVDHRRITGFMHKRRLGLKPFQFRLEQAWMWAGCQVKALGGCVARQTAEGRC